ncbi:hypothetical protein HYC85_019472 [Camellia sinensis]|uniref:Uncharacterized protein n=1 Tax=Camellia sinensis TaxID=4442 RepID=A0A7J7GM92_CAMSI|nr:hypothetical protein HYC85_019472 [Camellia sinensis]
MDTQSATEDTYSIGGLRESRENTASPPPSGVERIQRVLHRSAGLTRSEKRQCLSSGVRIEGRQKGLARERVDRRRSWNRASLVWE